MVYFIKLFDHMLKKQLKDRNYCIQSKIRKLKICEIIISL